MAEGTVAIPGQPESAQIGTLGIIWGGIFLLCTFLWPLCIGGSLFLYFIIALGGFLWGTLLCGRLLCCGFLLCLSCCFLLGFLRCQRCCRFFILLLFHQTVDHGFLRINFLKQLLCRALLTVNLWTICIDLLGCISHQVGNLHLLVHTFLLQFFKRFLLFFNTGFFFFNLLLRLFVEIQHLPVVLCELHNVLCLVQKISKVLCLCQHSHVWIIAVLIHVLNTKLHALILLFPAGFRIIQFFLDLL